MATRHTTAGSCSWLAMRRSSEGTVRTHVNRLLAKLDVRDRLQAVVFAYETGLVAPGHTEDH